MGGIPEGANVFPGYDSIIPKEAASVAEILKQSGYSTDPTYADKMMQFYRQLGCK